MTSELARQSAAEARAMTSALALIDAEVAHRGGSWSSRFASSRRRRGGERVRSRIDLPRLPTPCRSVVLADQFSRASRTSPSTVTW